MIVADVRTQSGMIPLYHRIYLLLRDQIRSGEIPFGAKISTELEIASQYGVSRITAKRALNNLATSNLVERRRRTGTRVIYRQGNIPDPEDPDGSHDEAAPDLLIETIECDIEYASPEMASALSIASGDPVFGSRMRTSLEGRPLAMIESVIPVSVGLSLVPSELSKRSIVQLLAMAGHVIGKTERFISAKIAGPFLAAQLCVEPWAAIIRIEQIIAAENGQPLARTVTEHRGDHQISEQDFIHS